MRQDNVVNPIRVRGQKLGQQKIEFIVKLAQNPANQIRIDRSKIKSSIDLEIVINWLVDQKCVKCRNVGTFSTIMLTELGYVNAENFWDEGYRGEEWPECMSYIEDDK